MRRSFSLYMCIMVASIVFMVFADSSHADDDIIRQVRIEGLNSMTRSDFLELFDVTINERLDRTAVRKGIKRTFLTSRFKNIVVVRDDSDPSTLIIKVVEKFVIDKITVQGLVDIDDRDIFGMFPIEVSDYFNKARLNSALRKLEERIAKMGYPGTSITSTVKFYNRKGTVALTLVVEEGNAQIMKHINVEGLADIEAVDRALIILKVFPGDVYDRNYLDDRLKVLRSHYKKKGYFNAAIGPYTYSDGTLTLHIDLGKLLVTQFDGNQRFSNSRLREEILFQVVERIDNEVIEDASERIINLYHKAGFAFAQVAPVIREQKGMIEVVFFIYEGNEVGVDTIQIHGNSIDERLIKDILSLQENDYFNPDGIDNDRKILQEFYYALGYREATVTEFEYEYNEAKTDVDITIIISEGRRILIGDIRVTGNQHLAENEILETIPIKPLSAYNEISVADARYAIINVYKRNGYLDVIVSIERKFLTNRAYLTFHIEEGTQYYFGYTIIRGNKDVKQKVITRELINEKGEPFDTILMRQNTQKLYKLGLFSSVDYKVVDDVDNQKSVVLNVEESNAGVLEWGVGYSTYERWRGHIDVSYKNFFGLNRVGTASITLTTISERYAISAYEPWLHHFLKAYGPLSLRIGALAERREEVNIDTGETRYKTDRYGVGTNFEMNFYERVKGGLLYSLSQNRTYDVQPDVILSKEDVGTLLISAITPSLIYDSRDNHFNPQNGNLTGLSMEVASQYIGSETDYARIEMKSSFYNGLSRRFILALSLRGGISHGLGETEELPLIKRFFLGGRTTVRGYVQDGLGPKGENGDPTGGNVFLMHNLELRAKVWKSIGVVTFLDGGNVWLTRDDVDLSEYAFTVGAGLRFMTPVGPFVLDYGYKLDREEGESQGELHFSVGHPF